MSGGSETPEGPKNNVEEFGMVVLLCFHLDIWQSRCCTIWVGTSLGNSYGVHEFHAIPGIAGR